MPIACPEAKHCIINVLSLEEHTFSTDRWPLICLLNTGNVLKLESQ